MEHQDKLATRLWPIIERELGLFDIPVNDEMRQQDPIIYLEDVLTALHFELKQASSSLDAIQGEES